MWLMSRLRENSGDRAEPWQDRKIWGGFGVSYHRCGALVNLLAWRECLLERVPNPASVLYDRRE